LDPVKGINYLIDSLKLLATSNTKFELIIVGDGPEYLNLKNQISDLNLNHVVHLVGEVSEDDLYSFYNISDIYISPTLQKDWIMGVADALACGLPVVSTGQGIIVKNGINGLVINQKSSDSIVKGINRVLQNKTFRNKNLLIEINKPILEMYDWDKIAKKAIRIYENSLS
jgi:glycosyltransferase involved in cell wall biosynthesis